MSFLEATIISSRLDYFRVPVTVLGTGDYSSACVSQSFHSDQGDNELTEISELCVVCRR